MSNKEITYVLVGPRAGQDFSPKTLADVEFVKGEFTADVPAKKIPNLSKLMAGYSAFPADEAEVRQKEFDAANGKTKKATPKKKATTETKAKKDEKPKTDASDVSQTEQTADQASTEVDTDVDTDAAGAGDEGPTVENGEGEAGASAEGADEDMI